MHHALKPVARTRIDRTRIVPAPRIEQLQSVGRPHENRPDRETVVKIIQLQLFIILGVEIVAGLASQHDVLHFPQDRISFPEELESFGAVRIRSKRVDPVIQTGQPLVIRGMEHAFFRFADLGDAGAEFLLPAVFVEARVMAEQIGRNTGQSQQLFLDLQRDDVEVVRGGRSAVVKVIHRPSLPGHLVGVPQLLVNRIPRDRGGNQQDHQYPRHKLFPVMGGPA